VPKKMSGRKRNTYRTQQDSRKDQEQGSQVKAEKSRLKGAREAGKEKCLRNGSEKRQSWALGFSRGRPRGSALKNLAGALHTEAARCIVIGPNACHVRGRRLLHRDEHDVAEAVAVELGHRREISGQCFALLLVISLICSFFILRSPVR